MRDRDPRPTTPEVLAPAGDRASLEAAVAAGADAVYFGLPRWNARARAKNVAEAELDDTMSYLRAHGVRGYVALNTLVFDHELEALATDVRRIVEAGADAVIVQDLGVARLVRALAPDLAIHASTQMTCTDVGSVELARSLGARRVVLARELSLDDIAAIRAASEVELEVFVHGALCVAYSGQCLTSEAIGGRSANRGACAQACRLPYELVVNGALRDLGDRAFLLSPEDLEASALVPELARVGVRSLKIEGRQKGPAYVSAATRLYREAVDALATSGTVDEELRRAALLAYSRGSGPGFLAGIDHQRLVEGRVCEHRGLPLGVLRGVERSAGRVWLRVDLAAPLARGQGIFVEGGWGAKGELGGPVWALRDGAHEVSSIAAGREVLVWLGPDRDIADLLAGRRVFVTSDPAANRAVKQRVESAPRRVPVSFELSGAFGERPVLRAKTEDGRTAEVALEAEVTLAHTTPLSPERLREQLERLGDTVFVLDGLTARLPAGAMLPVSAINRARRAIVTALVDKAAVRGRVEDVSVRGLADEARLPSAPPPAGLFVLCRTLPQARAAVAAGADGVYLDFLALVGTGEALRTLRAEGATFVGVAPPRIRKPGEDKVDAYLMGLRPDAVLVRGLGALGEGDGGGPLRVGDFSLNVTNRLAAAEVLARGLAAFTPAFDLDATQLEALLATGLAPFAEVVLYHPMPLFHMEHCVIAALLSDGRDHKTCGRPCEQHAVSLRDRTGRDHPVEADVGCRNTVFHGAAQSAAHLGPRLLAAGVRRFRVELVREDAAETTRIVELHRGLLAGRLRPEELRRTLRTESGYGVVSGSLRVL